MVHWKGWAFFSEFYLGKLEKCGILSSHMEQGVFGSISKQIGEMEHRLASIRSAPPSPASYSKERHIEAQLCELFEREEIMERQHSRVDWLKSGDRNMESF